MNTDIAAIIKKHQLWVRGEGGERANLRGANLYGADLYGANLRGADLRGADLRGADLREANLRGANLRGADLRGANLRGADLYGADLRGADLREAKDMSLPPFEKCPSEGSFVAWKAVVGAVLKIEIPAKAKRVDSPIGRKCRASYIKTLAAFTRDGKPHSNTEFIGKHDQETVYRIGRLTRADKFDPSPLVECTNGIHFFMTRREAEEWL